jgi:glycine/D-amino acid oxidase-like deaminating enzyme
LGPIVVVFEKALSTLWYYGVMEIQRKNKSFFIVGQGIAGSLLAWNLMKNGHNVTVIDPDHHESSSLISPGIINPITGQRLAVTPQYDLFFRHALKTYSQISAELGGEFLIQKPIIRVLRNSEEWERCHQLKTAPDSRSYVTGVHRAGRYGTTVHDPFGTLTIAKGGHLQTALLLKAMRKHFAEKKMLIDERLVYEDLKLGDGPVQWRSHTFDAVIFCEGFKAKQNPWFKDLPYNFAKGEILRIAFESAPLPDAILCQRQWCLPLQDGTYLAGSTYDRDNINTLPSPEGEAYILEGLSDFLPAKVNILERYAAVRPVMLNQKPVIKMHRTIPQLGIFNGFASKGILWAPYYAAEFAASFPPQ